MKTDYKIINETSYHLNTHQEVIDILENARLNKIRLIFDFGDTITGKSWGEVNDITGYVGRSSGTCKIPLLIKRKTSRGGHALLDHCIIGIKTSKGKIELYRLNNKRELKAI